VHVNIVFTTRAVLFAILPTRLSLKYLFGYRRSS